MSGVGKKEKMDVWRRKRSLGKSTLQPKIEERVSGLLGDLRTGFHYCGMWTLRRTAMESSPSRRAANGAVTLRIINVWWAETTQYGRTVGTDCGAPSLTRRNWQIQTLCFLWCSARIPEGLGVHEPRQEVHKPKKDFLNSAFWVTLTDSGIYRLNFQQNILTFSLSWLER